ncbi:S-DNA-T family DNA segregation ATPase FtsK/SpoIIIE [Allocatelliglobosispora scoriae]|uniref:S-DNA-T family DNA segregation ATPase FtsK/SpoIIIE n=1 Tax=Allocatelliglobosispora scoriae TaxID=643052 RepID=A0A841BKN2_9ACTN|nr:FtsK/SpoIIIE domain-containing protein [Allocatelliglobosispora scoriae]MBB5867370.1 S-DNA-T family DNA segregation ATPase FtsK/SpoIIIE [Allocatelliglobosispora scoriae]
MEWEIPLAGADGAPAAIIVRAGDAATVGDLRAALADAGRPDLDWACPDDTPLARAGLLTGRSPARSARAEHATAQEPWELAAIGGRDAGLRAAAQPGVTLSVGRSRDSALRLTDPEVSRRHATVAIGPDGDAVLADAGSRNGVVHTGHRLGADAALGFADTFAVGETVLAVRAVDPADAPIEERDGVLRYNRPPRIAAPVPTAEFTAPGRPAQPRGVRIPLVAALLPLLLAGAAWLLFPSAGYFLLFLALSPVLLIANFISDRRSGRREHRDALRAFEADHAAIAASLTALAAEQGRSRRNAEPDPALVRRIATGPTSRLFERRPDDADFLRLRVGLGRRPVAARITGQGADQVSPPEIEHCPVTLDLPALDVIGIAGPAETVEASARAVLGQLAALHAPHEVGLVVITGQDRAAAWDWAAWLPHTLPHTGDFACHRLIATDADQATARLAELRRIIEDRLADRHSALRRTGPTGRRMVLVVDGSRHLRQLLDLSFVLASGPEAGVYAVCLDSAAQNLPDECGATLVASGTRATVRRPGDTHDDDVLLDGTTHPFALEIGRALAPVRVLGGRGGAGAELPTAVRLLDLTGGADPARIEARWRDGGPVTALLGVGPQGSLEVDLRRDGPHALIAGTTGAGKSELLQTFVTSMALASPPDMVTFVLVDYKGGAAFADCRDLPHTVGMVTDLDGHLVNRALASLSAELRRREHVLAAAGATDIDDLLAKGGRLARLVIVIDEFASLLQEVPDFVTGIVGIGNRGRSLGVHVVLATQRPGGKVGADLRANLNLRVCLRVANADESNDVIDSPDAARLSRHHPGRGYLRSGHGDLTAFQTARAAWPRTTRDPALVAVRPWRVTDLGRPAPVDARPDGDTETDLPGTVAAIRRAAAASGRQTPPSPWLPPLPERIGLAELPPTTGGSAYAAGIGLADHPARQRQETFLLDLDTCGPVVVAGTGRSGRSTALRTIAAVLADRCSPADLHLYVLDQGNRALAGLAALPHCGAYADAEDTDRTERILAHLGREVSRRERDGATAPRTVLLIDRYEVFTARFGETDNGRLVDAVADLLRRGPAVGIGTVIATDKTAFGHRLANAAETRIVLRHADNDDLAAYGLVPREVPAHLPPGRALILPGPVETQLAEAEPATARLIQRWAGMPASQLPQRIDPLPAAIGEDELAALRLTGPPRPTGPAWCTLGCGGDHLAPVDVELEQGFLIAGPPGSGRSTALAAIAASLAGRASGQLPLVVLCPRRSPLRDLDGAPGIRAVLDGSVAGEVADALAQVPAAVIVDDAEQLADGAVAQLLEDFVRRARDNGSLVVAAGTTDDLQLQRFRGWLNLLRRNRRGLLLSPASHVDGELFDLQLPRSTGGAWPPGRALHVGRGAQPSSIQVTAAALGAERVPW